MGITVIPSMMIRTILGGTDVEQATRLQIIIMFLMAVSTALSCIIATNLVLWICVDSEQRIRSNCIDRRPHIVHRAVNSIIPAIINVAGQTWKLAMICVEYVRHAGVRISSGDCAVSPSERTPLLTGIAAET